MPIPDFNRLHDPDLHHTLQAHIRQLAANIGPRPPLSAQETQAFRYIRQQLLVAGVPDLRTLRYPAPGHAGRGMWLPLLVAAAFNLTPPGARANSVLWRLVRAGGAAAAFGAARVLLGTLRHRRPVVVGPTRQTSTQVGVIPAAGQRHHQLVLIAAVDSPPAYRSLGERAAPFGRGLGSLLAAAPLLNGLGQLGAALFGRGHLRGVRWGTATGAVLGAAIIAAEMRRPHTPGANDNASGVAALLALAGTLAANPLPHTEIWLVFTGATSAGSYGLHAFLDSYGHSLRTAPMINVARVGAGRLAVATAHASATYLTSYAPSPAALRLADAARQAYPVLGVEKRPVPGTDQTIVLRQRGFHGLTLTGYDPVTERPAAWHQHGDVPEQVVITGVERAVRFLAALAHGLDARPRFR